MDILEIVKQLNLKPVVTKSKEYTESSFVDENGDEIVNIKLANDWFCRKNSHESIAKRQLELFDEYQGCSGLRRFLESLE